MPPLLKYSNGWGHLIMSVSTQVIAVVLLLQNNQAYAGLGITLLLSVTTAWHITSAANSQQKIIEAQTKGQMQVTVTPPSPPAITISGGLSDGNSHS